MNNQPTGEDLDKAYELMQRWGLIDLPQAPFVEAAIAELIAKTREEVKCKSQT